MKDTVTVIGWISKGIFRGQIELPKEDKFSMLLFEGETEADWVNVSLADIFDRYRINRDTTAVRVLLVADTAVDARSSLNDVTVAQANFSWNDLTAAVKNVEAKPYTWNLDGIVLDGEKRNWLPVSLAPQAKSKVGYIYSFPQIKISEAALGKRKMQAEKKEQVQIRAKTEPKIQLKKESPNVFDVLGEIGREPKHKV
ncbi:hypothetical protein [uncultured Phascolarctobacterium sp.]|mgnify:FL=1|uniref:hypothetical protein n=1 Tax=uncultured Phascolarctobacterium sp. TaxID=512296 RepID=UPI0025ED8C75|nr:hypothetical protein [uncultured Phascolarctobacterium sp.]